ncbi:MAG: DUF4105 domain-containing protein [Pseudomonadota bacterium]
MGAIVGLWLLALGSIGDDDARVILVTYGPRGEAVGYFGHSVLWVRSHSRGLNAYFNLAARGTVSWDPRTYWKDRLTYWAFARPSADDLSGHLALNRSIRFQALSLTSDQADRLDERLREIVAPENNPFTYDFLTFNCTTRIRDLLDEVFDGKLRPVLEAIPPTETPRRHVLSAVPQAQRTILDFMLGAPMDRAASRWDEAFLPALLADAIVDVTIDGRPLVTADLVVMEGPTDAVQEPWTGHAPGSGWAYGGGSLALGIAGLALVATRRRWAIRLAGTGVALLWLGLGVAGGALVFNALGGVRVAAENQNLWIASPAYLLLAIAWSIWLIRIRARWLLDGCIVLASTLLALAVASMLLDTDHQNGFWLFALIPPIVAAVVVAFAIRKASQGPTVSPPLVGVA